MNVPGEIANNGYLLEVIEVYYGIVQVVNYVLCHLFIFWYPVDPAINLHERRVGCNGKYINK